MEKLDLIKILTNAPEGTELYTPLLGPCEFVKIDDKYENYPILVKTCVRGHTYYCRFSRAGEYLSDCGECGECVLFPSRENKDWSTFNVEGSFKVGDHVVNKETGEAYFLPLKKSTETKGFWAKRVVFSSLDVCEIFISEFMFDEYRKIEKFHPSLLNSFDMVLVRDTPKSIWFATLFSHLDNRNKDEPYVTCDGCHYTYCIPYNAETKDLLGTNNAEPDFYKK